MPNVPLLMTPLLNTGTVYRINSTPQDPALQQKLDKIVCNIEHTGIAADILSDSNKNVGIVTGPLGLEHKTLRQSNVSMAEIDGQLLRNSGFDITV